MKVATSIAVAVVMPFGLFVLAGVIVSHVLAQRRPKRSDRLETQSASTRGGCVGQPSALPLCSLELEPAAAQPTS
jgi:hypothetical protein